MPKTSSPSRSLLARVDAFTDAVVTLGRSGNVRGVPLGDAVAIVPGFNGNWPPVHDEMRGWAELGFPSVAVMFDRAAATGLPFCLAVQANVGGRMLGYPDCAFWMAADDDTLLFVPVKYPPAAGHFATAGGCLVHRAGRPADDLAEGVERAARQLAVVAKSHRRRGLSASLQS